MVAGQVDTASNVFDAYLGTEELSPSPYKVVELDPKTMKVRLLVSESNRAILSGETTPRVVKDELWVGSFPNTKIIRYPYK